jgi:hypothetical protein
MTIREVARQFGITLRTLCFYEAKRLIARSARAQYGSIAVVTASVHADPSRPAARLYARGDQGPASANPTARRRS